MRKFVTLCGVLVVILVRCSDGGMQSDAGGSLADASTPDATLLSCEGLDAEVVAVCVQPVDRESPFDVTYTVSGAVVAAGAGHPPRECGIYRLPDDARWFEVETVGGEVYTVGWRLGTFTPVVEPGDAIVLDYALDQEPFAPDHEHLRVERPGGLLVGWYGRAGAPEELTPPTGTVLSRGSPICETDDEPCGRWSAYDIEVTTSTTTGTVPYGQQATVEGLQFVGGVRQQTTTETQCMDWFVADAVVGLVPLPPEPTADEPRPAPLYPGPCVEEIDHGAEGDADERRTYTYDGEGRPVREEWDADADGTAESVVTRSYDAAGHLTSVRTQGLDEELGTDEIRYVYEDGQLVREELRDSAGEIVTLTT